MAGKTTFLKTMGVNAILAQTINTCMANRYEAPFIKVVSSISRSDNLLTGKSYYLCDKGLSFDYKLHPGPSTTRNAIALLEYVGYPKSIVENATRRADKDGINSELARQAGGGEFRE